MSRRETHIEHHVRQRLAEILSTKGVGFDRISLEVLYLLPPAFIDAYIDLYSRAFKDSSTGVDRNNIPIGKKPKGGAPAASFSRNRTFKEHWQIKDDQAFAKKRVIDAKLLRMVREIRGSSSDEKLHRARCSGCGRWVEKRWSYCGWCGIRVGDPR